MNLKLLGFAAALLLGTFPVSARQQQEPQRPQEQQERAVQESTPPQSDAADSLRIYISADMEVVVGVVSDAQIGPDGFEYERFRHFMTAEVNACIEAARTAGPRCDGGDAPHLRRIAQRDRTPQL